MKILKKQLKVDFDIKKQSSPTWKVIPTKVGDNVSARITFPAVERYSRFHLQH